LGVITHRDPSTRRQSALLLNLPTRSAFSAAP